MRKSKQYTIKKITDKEIAEYQNLMNSYGSFSIPTEWSKEGDTIQKYSLYEEYTPVKTSGNTTLLST
ncbi:MAG: hypothetical protein R2781_07700 [Flavobacteriaceae bacterium]